MLSTTASYRIASKDLTKSLKTTSDRPEVARETKYFQDNITKVKSIDDFLKDDRLYRFAMKAFGLDDMIYAKAFMKKVLKEGVSSSSSFANTLSDSRYRDFARAFNFERLGEATTQDKAANQKVVDNYVRLTFETNSGSQNEGVRLALYFARKAPNLSSTLGILADKALIQVVQTALNIPSSASLMDLDKQVAYYNSKLNIADFKDPEKLDKFIQRFTINWEMTQVQSSASSPANALLVGSSGGIGISANILASIQNLKLGGY